MAKSAPNNVCRIARNTTAMKHGPAESLACTQQGNSDGTSRASRWRRCRATEKVLNTANNIAKQRQRANQRTVRYVNPNGPGENGWFYDYYTYAPTYYNAPATGATVYGSATRYYDLDNDGVYESLNVFRDSDSNASYDTYDRYDFADVQQPNEAKNQSAEALLDSPEDANRHTVTGKVYASKAAKVNGTQNLIVRLSEAEAKDDSKKATIVDIGPAELWKDRPLQVIDSLTATGPVERIGDKLILIAETVKIGDREPTSICAHRTQMEGQVIDVTTTEVKGKRILWWSSNRSRNDSWWTWDLRAI